MRRENFWQVVAIFLVLAIAALFYGLPSYIWGWKGFWGSAAFSFLFFNFWGYCVRQNWYRRLNNRNKEG